ncbi:MAG: PKD domain-containing protein, partial [Saprospiraceae bacterium]|nr:PKD domain-containing protein [Saprospiraceae bacterium]
PNYRLGPLDGSSCDTLGIDNLPIAWWRSERDTLEPRMVYFHDLSYYEPATWSWDFGDGLPGSSERHPQHTFPAPGNYEVCLTVSNANGSNTLCRTLHFNASSAQNPDIVERISVSPNPFRERLAVAMSINLRSPVIRLYNHTGRLVRVEQLYFGITEIETGALPAGMYFWEVTAAGEPIKSGKLMKLE